MSENESQVKMRLNDIDNSLKTHERLINESKPTYAAKIASTPFFAGNTDDHTSMMRSMMTTDRNKATAPPRSMPSAAGHSAGPPTGRQPGSLLAREVSSHPFSPPPSRPGSTDGDWQTKQKRRNRPPQGIKGKASDQTGNIRARQGGPNRDLWISNVDNDIDDDDLKSFIENGGSSQQGKVVVHLWEKRYNDGSDSKRFRLTIGRSERVYKEDFWPSDIDVRRYWLSESEKLALRSKDPVD